MKCKIIGDACGMHDSEEKKSHKLVEIGKNCGFNAVKFQLLTDKEIAYGNSEFNWEWLPDLMAHGKELGVEIFASVFDWSGILYLQNIGCKSIKFAYSQQELAKKHDLIGFDNVYVSGDNIFCVPEYPAYFPPNFDGLFKKFTGFSSHYLGTEVEKKAIDAGCQVLEFHYKGDWVSECPDTSFAKDIEEAKSICDYANHKGASVRLSQQRQPSVAGKVSKRPAKAKSKS
jgi:sialic acid synthase SpsE